MAPRLLTNEEAGFSEEQLKKIATATEYKDKADAAFKTGDAKTALQNYHFAIMYVKGIDKNPAAAMSPSGDKAADDKPITEVDVMQEKIYGNMSACHLKLQNWQRAVETADACLKKNDGNLKALFRKGKALGEQGYWEKAEPILQDLLKKNPAEGPSINAEMARLQAIDKELQKKANKRLKGWMKRDKGDPEEAAAAETKDETSPAGPAPVSSATIEEVP